MNLDASATRPARPLRDGLRRAFGRIGSVLQRGRHGEPLPIVLTRKRIYILPTAFGFGFATILAVMLLGALNYSNNAALLLTALLGATAAGSMLTTFRCMDGLRLDGIRAGSARAGDPIRIDLDFAVAARARPALHLDIDEQTLAFHVRGEHNHTVELYLPTARRGWMALPGLRVHTNWPFGLFRAWSGLRPDRQVLVYPAPESGGPAAHGSDDGERRQRPRRHHGDDLASLRGYRSGDPRKLVAWKASARHEDLLVREFEHPATRAEWTLAWEDTAALAHEARIARLTRWVEEARSAKHARWTLRLPGRTFGPDSGTEHYHQCMRALALLPIAAPDA